MFHVCTSTKRKKHEPTHSENLTSGQIFFYNKVYFGWSERTALIKNCSDRACTLYTIHFTVYRMITPSFWRKGGGPRGDPTPGFGSVTQRTYAPFDFMTFTSSCVTLPFNPLFDVDVEDIGIFYLEK